MIGGSSPLLSMVTAAERSGRVRHPTTGRAFPVFGLLLSRAQPQIGGGV